MRYRDLLTIQKLTRTTDPQTRQRQDDVWTTFRTIRGTIADAKASDRFLSDINRDTLISHTITVPSNTITRQIKPAMRVRSGGKTYNIEAATDPKNRRREITLQVTEVANPK